jgi:hypothetical protein
MARILGTVSSGYVEQVYELSQTFNASGTYTVPAGKSQIAVLMMGAGGDGATPTGYERSGYDGGGSGGIVGFKDYNVSGGQTFTVTVGAANGATNFGNIATANSGGTFYGYGVGGSGGSGNGPAGFNVVTGATGGVGRQSANSGTAQSGSAGGNGVTLNMSLAGLGTVSMTTGGAGGGGGGGTDSRASSNVITGGTGGAGGTPGGGNGGNGANTNGANYGTQTGSAATSANSRGGGGGGGGGGATAFAYDGFEYILQSYAQGSSGGSGAPGQVVVYVK